MSLPKTLKTVHILSTRSNNKHHELKQKTKTTTKTKSALVTDANLGAILTSTRRIIFSFPFFFLLSAEQSGGTLVPSVGQLPLFKTLLKNIENNFIYLFQIHTLLLYWWCDVYAFPHHFGSKQHSSQLLIPPAKLQGGHITSTLSQSKPTQQGIIETSAIKGLVRVTPISFLLTLIKQAWTKYTRE